MSNTTPSPSPPSHGGETGGVFQRYQRPFWIALIVVALATASLLTYLLFFRQEELEPTFLGDAKLTIQAPQESVSGSELSYEITMENLSNTSLTNLVLEVFYPRGFGFLDSTPDPAPGPWSGAAPRQFVFADLKEKQKHKLIIVGKLTGGLQEIKTFGAKLHYLPENFRSAFTAEATANTVMLAPNLELSIEAPASLITGQTMIYSIAVVNVSDHSFLGVVIRTAYPQKFNFLTANPTPRRNQNQWVIEKLEAGQSYAISISGKLLEEPGKESLVTAEVFIPDEAGELVSAGRSFAFTGISSPPLRLGQELLQGGHTAKVGEALRYQVQYEHLGQTGLTDLQLVLVFEGLSPEFLDIKSQTGKIESQRIAWLPSTNPELRVLGPGAKGNFEFELSVTDQVVKELKKNPLIATRLEFSSRELPEPISSAGLEVKVETNLKLETSKTALGFGTYKISILVNNTVNDVEQSELTAVIPQGELVFDEPNLQFNSVSGLLRWPIGSLPAFDSRSLELTLTLNQTEQGSRLPLVKDIEINGRDGFTARPVSANVSPVEAD